MLAPVDVAILTLLLLAFALLVTTHLAVAARLLLREPWWRGLLALLVPVLAPYFAYKAELKVGAAMWLIGAFSYAVALIAALSI